MTAQEMGKFIARRRKELHMTQAELGEKVGVTDKAISRWERGVGFPDLGLFDALAQALGISSAELILGKKEEKSESNLVAESALELFEERIKKAKKWSVAALLWSVVLMIFSIGVAGYYVDDLRIRVLLIILSVVSSGLINATCSTVFGRSRF